ncbi:GTD2A protein, partial [Acromyrmex insinuator]
MIDSKNRFFGLIKQRAMQTITKIINVIKGDQKFLSHQKFQNFLEHNAIYTDVSLYCEIRWLSAGKCLEKFFTTRKKVFLFLEDQVPAKYEGYPENKFHPLCELALITDMTNHLNILNLKLQETNQTISEFINYIDSFCRKLTLFKNHLENNSHYLRLRNFDLRIFSMFGFTYLCEYIFTKMKFIKMDKGSHLNDASLSSLMRISSSTIPVDISSLILCKRPRSN